jgi:putative flippase GtrA
MNAVLQRAVRAHALVVARSRGRHARPAVTGPGARWVPALSRHSTKPAPQGSGERERQPPKGVGRSAASFASVHVILRRAVTVPAFVNFAIGGAAIAVLGALLLEALVKAGSPPLVAQAVQLTVTLILNFAYNYKITWRDRPRTGLPRQAVWFLVTRGLTQAGSWFGFALLTSAGLHYQLANAVCLAGAMAVNFVTSDKLVFRTCSAAKAAATHAKSPSGRISRKSLAAPLGGE